MEPFPGEKVTRKKRVKETVMLEIICTCRSIEDGNMVGCEVCKEWFHQGSLKVFEKINLQQHGCVIHARKNSRNKHSPKVIVIGFLISSFVYVWLVFIECCCIICNIYLAYAYCYLRGKYGAFTSYVNCTCIDL